MRTHQCLHTHNTHNTLVLSQHTHTAARNKDNTWPEELIKALNEAKAKEEGEEEEGEERGAAGSGVRQEKMHRQEKKEQQGVCTHHHSLDVLVSGPAPLTNLYIRTYYSKHINKYNTNIE